MKEIPSKSVQSQMIAHEVIIPQMPVISDFTIILSNIIPSEVTTIRCKMPLEYVSLNDDTSSSDVTPFEESKMCHAQHIIGNDISIYKIQKVI